MELSDIEFNQLRKAPQNVSYRGKGHWIRVLYLRNADDRRWAGCSTLTQHSDHITKNQTLAIILPILTMHRHVASNKDHFPSTSCCVLYVHTWICTINISACFLWCALPSLDNTESCLRFSLYTPKKKAMQQAEMLPRKSAEQALKSFLPKTWVHLSVPSEYSSIPQHLCYTDLETRLDVTVPPFPPPAPPVSWDLQLQWFPIPQIS